MKRFESNVYKNTNIDIRKEFEVLQNLFSIDILYCRTDKYIRCKCYDPLFKVGSPSCSFCFGRGFLYALDRVKCIQHTLFNFIDGINQSNFGSIPTGDESFYFKHDFHPKVGDLIIITAFNKKNMPAEVQEVYEVRTALSNRGDNGRIEYFTVMGRLRDDKLNQINKMICNLDNKGKHLLSKGKRYICQIDKA